MESVKIEYPDKDFSGIHEWKMFDENGQDTFKNVDQIEMMLSYKYVDDDGKEISSFAFGIEDMIDRKTIDILKSGVFLIKMRHIYKPIEGESK